MRPEKPFFKLICSWQWFFSSNKQVRINFQRTVLPNWLFAECEMLRLRWYRSSRKHGLFFDMVYSAIWLVTSNRVILLHLVDCFCCIEHESFIVIHRFPVPKVLLSNCACNSAFHSRVYSSAIHRTYMVSCLTLLYSRDWKCQPRFPNPMSDVSGDDIPNVSYKNV